MSPRQLTTLPYAEAIYPVIETLQQAFAIPIQIGNYEVTINANIGIVFIDPSYRKAEYLLRDADLAMLQAKQQQRGSWRIFKPEMHQQALRRLSLEGSLRQALNQNQLEVYYQPIVAMAPALVETIGGRHTPLAASIMGYEALIRWRSSPTSQFISPSTFIPLAEETGLISPLGHWVFQRACQQLSQWNNNRPGDKALFMSINISVHQLNSEHIIETIEAIVQQTQVQPHWLKLEITESILMQNSQPVITALTHFRQRGMQVSIDDFGTGYSSLSYLKRLPVDTVKIDRTFIQDLETDPDNIKILEAILTLALALELDVVTEGIETEWQAQKLTELGCTYGQGYWFSKPLDRHAAEAILQ